MTYGRGGTFGTHGESREIYKESYWGKSEGKKLLRSLGIDLMII